MDLIAYAPQSKVLTSTGTAVSTLLPLDQTSGYPKEVRITATAPCYVELGDIGVTAVVGDALVQPRDSLVVATCGARSISVISVSGTASITVTALESGSVQSALTSPSLSLDMLSGVLSSAVTSTRASSGTYFDSTGRLATASNDVARFDNDPATPVGTVGGELVTNGDFSQGTTGWSVIGTGGSAAVVNGELELSATAGNFPGVRKAVTTEIGKRYIATVTARRGTATSDVGINANGLWAGQTTATNSTTNAQISIYFTAQVTSTNIDLSINSSTANGTAYFDNISVKEVTFAPRGLLIEEQRTNLLLHSRDMTQAAWSKTDVTPTRNQVGIDGTANSACLMTEGSAGTAIAIQNGAAVTAGSTVTGSLVIKRGNTDWVLVQVCETTGANAVRTWFNLNTGAKGTVTAVGAATATSSSITSLGGGWYRVAATCLPDGTYTVPQIRLLACTGDGSTVRVSGATYIVDCAQLEVGSFATSIITTGAATVTRAADSASMTGTNFSSWFNASAGTFVAEVTNGPTGGSGFPWVLCANDGTAVNEIGFYKAQAVNVFSYKVQTASVAQMDGQITATLVSGSNYKLAGAYAANSVAGVGNGGTPVTVGTATIPTVNQLWIGRETAAGSPLNGWIRRITYYPVRLGNSQLQALTA